MAKTYFNMKKLTFVIGIAALSLVSCKKTWTCDCTSNSTYNGTPNTTTSKKTVTDKKKGEAETECTAYANENTYSTSNYSITTTCETNKTK